MTVSGRDITPSRLAVLALGLIVLAAALIGSGASYLGAVVAIATVALALVFVVHPVAAVLALVSVRPLVDSFVHQRLVWRSFSVSLGTAWGAIFIITLLAYFVRRRPPRSLAAGYLVPVLFLVGYALLTLGRDGRERAVTNGSRVAALILLMLAIEGITRNSRGQTVVVLAFYPVAIMSVISVGIALMRNRYGTAYYDLALPTSRDQLPYAYAEFALLIIPFIFGAIMAGFYKILPSTLAALLTASVILSFSRTTYLALALIGAAFLLVALRNRQAYALFALLGMIAVAVASSALFYHRIVERFLHGGQRLVVWKMVLHSVLAQPSTVLLGGGANFSLHAFSPGVAYLAHNDLLEVFATGGIVLVVLFVGLLVWMAAPLVRLARSRRHTLPARDFGVVCVAAFCAFVAMGMLDEIIFTVPSVVMAVLVGLVRGMNSTPNATFMEQRLSSSPFVGPCRTAASVGRLPDSG